LEIDQPLSAEKRRHETLFLLLRVFVSEGRETEHLANKLFKVKEYHTVWFFTVV
jgi:hypothetical protein